ncbi:GAF domain-containing protein [Streptomyces sp. NPDC046237]|uniref:GAF domain-containing protein n=1 Tax=Streptomyces sp. NPDC046237 TaxID=3154914 RepID=UPI0033C7F5AB
MKTVVHELTLDRGEDKARDREAARPMPVRQDSGKLRARRRYVRCADRVDDGPGLPVAWTNTASPCLPPPGWPAHSSFCSPRSSAWPSQKNAILAGGGKPFRIDGEHEKHSYLIPVGTGYEAVIAVPVIHGSREIGVLAVDAPSFSDFIDPHVTLMESLANTLAASYALE